MESMLACRVGELDLLLPFEGMERLVPWFDVKQNGDQILWNDEEIPCIRLGDCLGFPKQVPSLDAGISILRIHDETMAVLADRFLGLVDIDLTSSFRIPLNWILNHPGLPYRAFHMVQNRMTPEVAPFHLLVKNPATGLWPPPLQGIRDPQGNYLAVSINAPDDELRSRVFFEIKQWVKEGRLRAGRDLLRGWGTLELKGKDLSLQLSVRSKGLDLRPWKALLKGKAAKGGLRLEGRISWRVGALRFGKFTLRGAQGTVHLRKGGTRVDLQRGRICGIGVRGVLSSTTGLSSLDLTLEAAEAPLRETLRCLGGKEGMADGAFLLEAELRAKGRKDLLRESSTGSLYLFSAQGRIYRLTLLARLFSVLNVMEMFKGRFPDFTGEGFPYDRLEITGRLKDGRLTIQEGVIEGPALKIFGEGTVDLPTGRLDLVVLVAPLRTVDTLLSRIPLVGQVVTGKSKTFLSFPFKVEGPLQDPKVTPLPPSAIGKGLLGVVKRTLELPFKVIEPVFP